MFTHLIDELILHIVSINTNIVESLIINYIKFILDLDWSEEENVEQHLVMLIHALLLLL